MKIELHKIKYYFLTCDVNNPRGKHITEHFKQFNPVEVNPIMKIPRYKSGSSGFLRMIDAGLKDQKRDEPFQPYIMLEDDAAMVNTMPEFIEVPDDTDILYIGLTKYAMEGKRTRHLAIYHTTVDGFDNVYRIYNILASHGIMVCSARGASAMEKAEYDSHINNRPWDIPLAYMHPFYNVYALKNPLVYQYQKVGGHERATKITFDTLDKNALSKVNKPIPQQFIIPGTLCEKTSIQDA